MDGVTLLASPFHGYHFMHLRRDTFVTSPRGRFRAFVRLTGLASGPRSTPTHQTS